MSSQIQDVVSACGICNTYQRKNQKEPLIPHSVHSTPQSDSIGSPAQRLMGRRTKTLLPTSSALLKPKTINPKAVQEELQKQ